MAELQLWHLVASLAGVGAALWGVWRKVVADRNADRDADRDFKLQTEYRLQAIEDWKVSHGQRMTAEMAALETAIAELSNIVHRLDARFSAMEARLDMLCKKMEA